jgi:methionine-rich copper-binding protein CopC
LFVDGTEVDSWSGTTAWTTHAVDLPAGPHTIEWRYTKDGSLSSGTDTVWIDDVRLTPPPGPVLTFAAWDFEGSGALPSAFTTSGDASWSVTTATSRSGTASAVAGDIGNSQTTSLQLVATWPAAGAVTFAYSVSSELDYDFLEFWVDGVRIARWSGSISWTTFTHDLAAGEHTLEWRYDKDISLSVGSDAGWIDDVELSTTTVLAADLCSAD